MAIPEILPISRMEDYYTHYLGIYSDGRQFWGRESVTVLFSTGSLLPSGEIADKELRGEFVILHFFDKYGTHLNTEHKYVGISEESDLEQMKATLESWIDEGGTWEFADISVKLFQIHIQGFVFGLQLNEQSESIDLLPDYSISFMEPWDGEYYT